MRLAADVREDDRRPRVDGELLRVEAERKIARGIDGLHADGLRRGPRSGDHDDAVHLARIDATEVEVPSGSTQRDRTRGTRRHRPCVERPTAVGHRVRTRTVIRERDRGSGGHAEVHRVVREVDDLHRRALRVGGRGADANDDDSETQDPDETHSPHLET